MIAKNTSLVGVVENVEFIVVNILPRKDIGDKFQDRGLSDASLSNKKDRVRRVRLVLGRLDNPMLKGLYIAKLL